MAAPARGSGAAGSQPPVVALKESEHHRRYAAWLAELVAGSDELALHDITLTGMARIATNPRIYAEPAPMPVVVAFLDRLRNARRARWLASGRTERSAQAVTSVTSYAES